MNSSYKSGDLSRSELSNASGANAATADHPAASKPDPTITNNPTPTPAAQKDLSNNAAGGITPAASTGAASLSGIKMKLRSKLRQFPDFPSKGILFEDIMPIFADPSAHQDLIIALELQVAESFKGKKIDVVVGLESRGFLFGPTLALRLGAGFVPVRKQGKLPGECETASYQKEYGADFFQMQKDGVSPGQKVLVVDDIIATGGSAAAAGTLVKKIGGELVGYLFLMELDFLKGREKLDAPVHTLLTGQEEGLKQ